MFMEHLSIFLQELIGKMLQVKAEARYTAQDVLLHSWVTVLQNSVTLCVSVEINLTLGK